MVPVEWKEGGQLHPSIAEFFVSIAVETTRVDTKHRNAKQRKGKRLRDGEKHVQPLRAVIATPMPCPATASWKSGPTDDEGPFVGENTQQGLVCGIEDLVSVCISVAHENLEVIPYPKRLCTSYSSMPSMCVALGDMAC